ncbi:MAG: penicillin-binding transpeptidase domain-containing protein [Thermoanaerobaculia bacterium]|nr:penicillin-binding transpeptidase domain-containing protein [Thermoanaerobaculia bacterium]
MARHASGLQARGLGNVAAVAIEVPSRSIRALVGSADFFDIEHDGQVDGTRALRSPGSTLKPLLYALAFDRGVVLPDSSVLDVPTDFNGYRVENFDGRYRGRTTARMALVESLNTPAVRLLSDVGVAPFLELLQRGGLSTLDRTADEYGLPLGLGGGEVRLLDLVNLYASLADGGRYRSLTWLTDADPGREVTLVSPWAAEDVGSILRGLARPDLPSTWDLTVGAPAVAWKTGTSFGHRDAWAVGFTGRLAIGVWVGSFDGRAHLGISGGEHAGPILFDLFRALDPGGGPPMPPPGERPRLELCAHSRQLPGAYCPERQSFDAYPATRLGLCPLHRRALVDRETGELLLADCLRDRPSEWRLFTVEPAELVAFWRAAGREVVDLPPYSRACRGIPSGRPPRIVSPDRDTPYRLRPEAPLEFQKIALEAQVAPGVTRLWWYQDGRLVATGAPGEALFVPPVRGRHRLVATDDGGRSGVVEYRVE